MLKKIIVILILFISANVSFAEPLTCKTAMNGDKPFIVLYSSEMCTYCRKFKPIFNELKQEYNKKFNFVVVDVYSRSKNGICDSVYIRSIPTVYIFNPETGKMKYLPSYMYFNKPVLKKELNEYHVNKR